MSPSEIPTVPAPEPLPLSRHLRQSTMREHRNAEASPFIVGLLGGALTLEDYSRYLVNMAWLYKSLEEQCTKGEPLEGSYGIWDPRLNRGDAITSDLFHLGVTDWETNTMPSKAMASYIDHVASMEGRSDPRLIAHHYTRYLGDLSGGQGIATLVARHYGATKDQLSFYRFEGIENLVRFKEGYRKALDSIVLTAAQHASIIAEAKSAFVKNQQVFDDLATAA
ncbi:MAG: heme oxygenase [Pontimonas sp.]